MDQALREMKKEKRSSTNIAQWIGADFENPTILELTGAVETLTTLPRLQVRPCHCLFCAAPCSASSLSRLFLPHLFF